MLPYRTLLSVNKTVATPIYQQLANGLVKFIRAGILKPGSSLPSTREMAKLLRVHRKTIVAAYEELHIQGWVEAFPRKGIFISSRLPELTPIALKAESRKSSYAMDAGFAFQKFPSVKSLASRSGQHKFIVNDGFPDVRIAPADELLREYRSLFHKPTIQRKTVFGDLAGSPNLRIALAQFLSETRGLTISSGNVIITHGAQMAIFMAARMILRPGSTVVVGEPNYFMANMIFEQAGAKLVRVPVDENGIDVNAIEKICKKKRPDLLYVIPHHHHPTTVMLSAIRRMKLLQLIQDYKLPVIEDDYDYDFHYSSSPILPLASAGHGGNVIYIGSLTKSLASSFRVGYMIAPENFIREATELRRLIDIRGDSLLEEALAILFGNGTIQKHLRRSVKLYHQRRDHFCDLLKAELAEKVIFEKPSGGMAVWVRFSEKYPLPIIAKRASEKGVYINDGAFYSTGKINYNASRMGFASLNDKEADNIIEILRKVMP